MTVSELIEDLKKVHNQNSNVVVIDYDGNILKCDGFDLDKVVEVNCNQDNNVSNVYLVTQ